MNTKLSCMLLVALLIAVVSSNNKRIVVISDLHLGSSWLRNAGNEQLVYTFLDQVPRSGIDTLIVNGDIFELWNFNIAGTL